ncbi:MAG: LuxR C-terminal-related transcriptional regulator [Terriglobia bacterium]
MKQKRANGGKKIQVLIADHEAVFRIGLRRLLTAEGDLEVVAEAENATQALHATRQTRPDVVFIQAEIVPEKSLEIITRLRAASPGCKLVITATAIKDKEPLRYIRAGAAGVILKSLDPALFVKCARKVTQDEIWLPKKDVAQMAQTLDGTALHLPRPVDTLTQREKTIISLLVQGWRNREIAGHLVIKEQTVKNHLRAVYDKVGVSDRLELVLYVIHQRVDLPAAPPQAQARN